MKVTLLIKPDALQPVCMNLISLGEEISTNGTFTLALATSYVADTCRVPPYVFPELAVTTNATAT